MQLSPKLSKKKPLVRNEKAEQNNDRSSRDVPNEQQILSSHFKLESPRAFRETETFINQTMLEQSAASGKRNLRADMKKFQVMVD